MQPYCPVARGGNLIILKIQELIGWYVIRQDIVAVSLQHGREDDAVEHDVVLTDEVNETCLWILPPLLPCTPFLWLCIAKLLGVGDVADRSIKPNIEHLAFCSLYRNRNTPIQVAGHRTRLQVHIQPALALSVNIGTPLLVTFQDPLLQPVLILAQWEIPVLGRLLDESMTRVVLIGRVDQLFWREGSTTFLALVAVCSFCTAARAGTHDVTVGKELAGNLIAELLFYFLFQNTLIVKSTEEIRSKLIVNLRSCAAVNIKGDTEILEALLDEVVIAIHYFLYGNAFLLGTDGDRYTMLVATADENNVLLFKAKIAYVDIGWHINTCQVADMHTTVSVRQCCRNSGTFEILLFHIS